MAEGGAAEDPRARRLTSGRPMSSRPRDDEPSSAAVVHLPIIELPCDDAECVVVPPVGRRPADSELVVNALPQACPRPAPISGEGGAEFAVHRLAGRGSPFVCNWDQNLVSAVCRQGPRRIVPCYLGRAPRLQALVSEPFPQPSFLSRRSSVQRTRKANHPDAARRDRGQCDIRIRRHRCGCRGEFIGQDKDHLATALAALKDRSSHGNLGSFGGVGAQYRRGHRNLAGTFILARNVIEETTEGGARAV